MKSEVIITDDRLQITRVFNAPREVVFTFWKEAEKVRQWSGCKDATRVEIEMDFRVGGSFTQKMYITGAGEFTITGIYDEIIEPERIAYHVNLGAATTRLVVEFIDQGEQTRVILTQEGFPDENLSRIVSEGTLESLDKLEDILAIGSHEPSHSVP